MFWRSSSTTSVSSRQMQDHRLYNIILYSVIKGLLQGSLKQCVCMYVCACVCVCVCVHVCMCACDADGVHHPYIYNNTLHIRRKLLLILYISIFANERQYIFILYTHTTLVYDAYVGYNIIYFIGNVSEPRKPVTSENQYYTKTPTVAVFCYYIII